MVNYSTKRAQSIEKTTLEEAQKLHNCGYAVIPVPRGRKRPTKRGWQKLRLTKEELPARFGHGENIGVLLGEPSGGLVDVDLDCPEAIALAERFLFDTGSRFGRPGRPSSHWLYKAEGAKTHKFETKEGTIVEIRSTGRQTIFPLSIHQGTGEVIRWEAEGDPAKVDSVDLEIAVGRLAAAAILARHWPEVGSRQDAALALAGGLIRAVWTVEEVIHFVTAICEVVGDEEIEMRLAAVKATAKKAKATDEYLGFPALAGIIGSDIVGFVRKWLKITSADRDFKGLPAVYDRWIEDLEKTRKYFFNEAGFLCYEKFQKNGETSKTPIANFAARPVNEIHRDDGIEIMRAFEIEGILAGGKPLPAIFVTTKDFPGMNWPIQWGLMANIEPLNGSKDKLRHCIQALSWNIPIKTVYTHLGWRKIDGKWVYLHGGGAVGSDAVIVELDQNLQRYTLGAPDPQTFARSLSLLEIAPAHVTIPFLAITFLAPLCEALRQAGIEPAFVLWVYGITGSGKSTVAALYLNHFGDFTGRSLPGNFKDTFNSLEKSSFLLKDAVFVVDDYQLNDELRAVQKKKQTAQELLRAYGDRTGKNRMKADTSLRPGYPPRGMCIITGEDKPQGQSSTARFLTVEVGKGDINLPRLTDSQAHAGELSQAMGAYVRWLAPQMGKLPGELKAKFMDYRNKAYGTGHGRLPEGVAWLYIGLEMGLSFAVDTETIGREDADHVLKKGWEIFMDMAESQGREIEDERPTIKFIRIFNEILTTGAARTMKIGEDFARPENFIGWEDEQYFYLLPDTVYKTLVQFSNGQGSHFPVTARTLWKQLNNEGFIQKSSEGPVTRFTKVKKINGKNERVIWLAKTIGDLAKTDVQQEPRENPIVEEFPDFLN